MFLDTGFLKNDEIQLVLEKTVDGDEERNWVPAYHLSLFNLSVAEKIFSDFTKSAHLNYVLSLQ